MVSSIKKLFCVSAVAACVAVDYFTTTRVALGVSVNKLSEYPVVLSLDINQPICYIQKSNGSTIDLSNLCRNRETETQLSKIDRNFLNSYNKLLNTYQSDRTLVSPSANNSPSPMETGRGVCSALKNKTPLEQIRIEQYEKIAQTEDPRNQKIAVVKADIIYGLALRFYCPEFAK